MIEAKEIENEKLIATLSLLQRKYSDIYSKTGLCGISPNHVQLDAELFMDLFSTDDFIVSDFSNEYPYELSIIKNGVKFMAITDVDPR